MKVSREQMAANRARILEEAGRLFRAKGFDEVSVAEVMKASGLTHGGFYGHFASKDDLIAQSIAHVFAKSPPGEQELRQYSEAYLADAHRRNPGRGCPMAALASETARQSPQARRAMTDGIKAQIDRIASTFTEDQPEAARRRAIGTWSAMVGAMILARSSEDSDLADELLNQTRAWICHDQRSEGSNA
ncbi:TetR/AcrR family transcriptional repressor of nem operon [Brevundimonas vesicularis]|uniref:TetR/AcrR family transcriptional repressor of nem operon n=1 Tax=Brevundimonas vesicularis TaxID=41276 RepID=A0A7W9FRP6_BREVE|nr:TetR/AcrR family transcriptional regulator [Brevundimonas vesicularis]MBB5770256.1 TetR/AcrR family transcriptional repressor of nem operon [Brevundimonas vesicularis]